MSRNASSYASSMLFVTALITFVVGLSMTSCTGPMQRSQIPSDAVRDAETTAQRFEPVGQERILHNAHHVTDKVISGAQPEGDESYKLLRQLGVTTIVSVDGAKPDVASARKFGIRYIHLPIGYDDVPEETGLAIAKAIEQNTGKVYIHCHHGKHRSAAATAVACVYQGSLSPEEAESVLKTFGTGENYTGLWAAARNARPVGSQTLKEFDVDYVEIANIPPLAEAMVKVDHHWDNLKIVQKANWRQPADHPDLDPPHEALQLTETLHEIARAEEIKDRPEEFQTMLAESEQSAESLRTALTEQPRNIETIESMAKLVANSCTKCHKEYRD